MQLILTAHSGTYPAGISCSAVRIPWVALTNSLWLCHSLYGPPWPEPCFRILMTYHFRAVLLSCGQGCCQSPRWGFSWLLTDITQFINLAAETAWEKQALIYHQRLGLTKAIKKDLARAGLPQSQPVRPGFHSGEATAMHCGEHTHVLAGAQLHFTPSPLLTLPHRRGACGGSSHNT